MAQNSKYTESIFRKYDPEKIVSCGSQFHYYNFSFKES